MTRFLGAMFLALFVPCFVQAQDLAPRRSVDSVIVQNDGRIENAVFAEWRSAFRVRALSQGISAQVFDRAFQGVTVDPVVLGRDRKQAEFTKTMWEYLDTAVSDIRVSQGREALRKYAGPLDQIEQKYKVDKEVIVAIWGLESNYGSLRGDRKVIRSLATLAYDGRRKAFFEEQLIAALKIIQNGDVTSEEMYGSWAGAMGHTQFMPTSWWAYAVDYDGDGKRHIWGDDPVDALASAASYMRRFGWRPNAPWGIEVILPENFNYNLAGRGVKPRTGAEWYAIGLRPAHGFEAPVVFPDYSSAWLFLPAGTHGAAFLVFSNFGVIRRYNAADSYAVAVGHLADRLKGKGEIVSNWPRNHRALSRDEKVEIQRRLTAAGYDTDGIDGMLGPNTVGALRAWQKDNGYVPDGYANAGLLEKLR